MHCGSARELFDTSLCQAESAHEFSSRTSVKSSRRLTLCAARGTQQRAEISLQTWLSSEKSTRRWRRCLWVYIMRSCFIWVAELLAVWKRTFILQQRVQNSQAAAVTALFCQIRGQISAAALSLPSYTAVLYVLQHVHTVTHMLANKGNTKPMCKVFLGEQPRNWQWLRRPAVRVCVHTSAPSGACKEKECCSLTQALCQKLNQTVRSYSWVLPLKRLRRPAAESPESNELRSYTIRILLHALPTMTVSDPATLKCICLQDITEKMTESVESADELTTLNHFSISTRCHQLTPQRGLFERQWGGGWIPPLCLSQSTWMETKVGLKQSSQTSGRSDLFGGLLKSWTSLKLKLRNILTEQTQMSLTL